MPAGVRKRRERLVSVRHRVDDTAGIHLAHSHSFAGFCNVAPGERLFFGSAGFAVGFVKFGKKLARFVF